MKNNALIQEINQLMAQKKQELIKVVHLIDQLDDTIRLELLLCSIEAVDQCFEEILRIDLIFLSKYDMILKSNGVKQLSDIGSAGLIGLKETQEAIVEVFKLENQFKAQKEKFDLLKLDLKKKAFNQNQINKAKNAYRNINKK